MYKLVIKDDESNKTVIAFYRQEITIGREEGNTIRLTEQNVSRKHAKLTKSNNLIFLEDSKSHVGTFLNNESIKERKQLNNGDEIKIGDYLITIINENEDNEETVLINDSEDTKNEKRIKPVPVSEITGKKSENKTELSKDLDVSYPLKPPYNRVVFQDTNLAGTSFDILKSIMTIGKAPDCDIIISNKSFSDIEAKIICNENSVKIKDLSNKNTLKVNGDPYSILELREADIITISSVSFRYCDKRSTYKYKGSGKKDNTKLFAIIGGVIVLAIIAIIVMFSGDSKDVVKENNTNKEIVKSSSKNLIEKDDKKENHKDISHSLSPELLNLITSGKQLIKDENWGKAEGIYKEILKKSPNNKDAQKDMKLINKELKNETTYKNAATLFRNKKFKEAVDSFNTIPEGTTYNKKYNKKKKGYFKEIIKAVDSEVNKKRYKKARELLSVANELDYDSEYVLQNLNFIDKKTGKKKTTYKRKNKVKKIRNAGLAKSLTKDAQGLMIKSKYAAASKKIRAAIKADSSFAQQYMVAGQIYEKMGNKQKSIKYFKIFLKLKSKGRLANFARKKIKELQK